MTVYASVITYNPNVNDLKSCLDTFKCGVNKILLWRNSGDDLKLDGYDVELLGDGTNRGISYALNSMLRWCSANGVDYLLTMDQDSHFVNAEQFVNRAVELLKQNDDVVAVGPEVRKSESQLSDVDSENCRTVGYLITSGSLVCVDRMLNIGGYSEKYFVDGIDIDMGYKAGSYGYKCLRIGRGCLLQSFGQRTGNSVLSSAAYSPQRLQNIAKAYVMIICEFFPKTGGLLLEFLSNYFVKKPAGILLFQKNKCSKLWAIMRGTLSGLKVSLSSKR